MIQIQSHLGGPLAPANDKSRSRSLQKFRWQLLLQSQPHASALHFPLECIDGRLVPHEEASRWKWWSECDLQLRRWQAHAVRWKGKCGGGQQGNANTVDDKREALTM
jgi:hypothetical protein